MYGTSTYQYPFSTATDSQKRQVWEKGRIIPGYDADIWRYDACGALMQYSQHGNRNSDSGWEIDHIFPKEKGGGATLSNLQPLNWRNNAAKSDTYPWNCGR